MTDNAPLYWTTSDAAAAAWEAAWQTATTAKKEKDIPATVPDNSQHWAGMDGAIAWHLIERHADSWADIGKMMREWLESNQQVAILDERERCAKLCEEYAGMRGTGAWVALTAAADRIREALK